MPEQAVLRLIDRACLALNYYCLIACQPIKQWPAAMPEVNKLLFTARSHDIYNKP